MRARVGHLLISFDPDVDRVIKEGMKFDIILPDGLKHKPRTAFCHSHCVSKSWDEVDLTNKRVIVDRWGSRPFKVVHDGREYTFYSISQWAVLAIFEEEQTMTRDEFKNNLNGFIDNLIPEDRELTEADENNLTDNLGEVAGEIILNEDDDEDKDEKGEG